MIFYLPYPSLTYTVPFYLSSVSYEPIPIVFHCITFTRVLIVSNSSVYCFLYCISLRFFSSGYHIPQFSLILSDLYYLYHSYRISPGVVFISFVSTIVFLSCELWRSSVRSLLDPYWCTSHRSIHDETENKALTRQPWNVIAWQFVMCG